MEDNAFMESHFLRIDDLAKFLLTLRDPVHTFLSRRKTSCLKRQHGLPFDRSEIRRWLENRRYVTTKEALEVVEA